jgi:NTP pyrophosphatase (non-canonical NTP hydrolase)
MTKYNYQNSMKTKYTLNETIKDTKEVAQRIKNKNWTIHTRFVELVEEVGELANAIQTEEGFKSKKRKKSDITNSVCDILFEVLLIADHYKIDLDKEYPEVLKEIDERNKNGDFDELE